MDDFVVAMIVDEQIAVDLINDIDSHMIIDMKDLAGLLTRYNGVGITQSKYFVKLSKKTYINKLLLEHDWILQDNVISNIPIPI